MTKKDDQNIDTAVQLQELKSKIEAMEEMANMGVWTLDLETMVPHWSDMVYQIHGVPVGTPVNKIDAVAFYAKEERPRLEKYLQRCIEFGESFDDIFRFFDNQGTAKWVRSLGSALRDSSGKIVSLTGSFQDVTQLKESEEEKNAILESTGMGIWVFYPQSQKLIWDKSMYRLYEISESSFSGHYEAWEKSLHPDDKSNAVKELEQSLAGNKDFDIVFRILTQNGNLKHIKGRATITRDKNGAAEVMRGVNWDITRDVEIQEELAAQKRIAYHQAKLASIGELAAGVGHEINNPLAIVSGYVDKIRRELNKDDLMSDFFASEFTKINHATDRIANIVNGLRTFSRSDVKEFEHFNISDALSESVTLVENIFKGESIFLNLNVDDNAKEALIYGNRGRINQVVMNLLTNARDALKNNADKKIEINLVLTPHQKVRINISDNGCGMSDELKAKVFEPFFTTKEVNKGTGIGLALVRQIVEEHQGAIDCETDLGKGTVFSLEFKKSEVQVSTKGSVSKAEDQEQLFSGHVLIAEDEVEIKEILVDLLEDIGLTVESCSNGKEAFELIEKQPNAFDLLVTDVKMPLMGGPELIEKLRNSEHQLKIMISTGGSVEEISKEGDKTMDYVDAVLLKPYRKAEVHDILATIFK